MRRTCNWPPPNSYDPNFRVSQDMKPTWGFGTSKRGNLTSGKNCAPSMQTYNLPSKVVEHSSWSMGLKLENRSSIGSIKTKFVPGPGTYQPDFAKSIKKNPEFSMKGRYKTAKRLDVPGPGTYDKSLKDK